MYEEMTFENLMDRALGRIPREMDKRQGSIIYDALAPAIAEITQMYIELEYLMDMTYADTAVGEFLERRTAEQGIFRKPATKAIRLGVFKGREGQPLKVETGTRMNLDELNYVVLSPADQPGHYKLECETPGRLGGQFRGKMTPIDTIPGLTEAELLDVLIPGEDQEEDEALLRRYVRRITERPFGGNRADYREKILGMEGVGAVKLERGWKGGGTVRAFVLDASFGLPSLALLNKVQEAVDPLSETGDGQGCAPLFHQVTIAPPKILKVTADIFVQPNPGMELSQLQEPIQEAFEKYLLSLRKTWQDNPAVVRISALEQAILNQGLVLDIRGTQFNGREENLVIPSDGVPIMGGITLHAIQN